MAAELRRKSTGLTDVHDRLLDVIAEHLVEEYLKEIEAGQTGIDERQDCEGHA